MFREFMRVWETTQPAPSDSDEPQSARQAQLDRLREAMEHGPGGDVDADGRVTRAGLSYVPGLKRTVSEWMRMRERYERGELGGALDGQGSCPPVRRHARQTERGRSARYVRRRVRTSRRLEQLTSPAHEEYSCREVERTTWDDVLDRDLKYMVMTWLDTVLWEFVLLGALAALACAAFDAAAVLWLVGFVALASVAAVVITIMLMRARTKLDTTRTESRPEEAGV